MGIRRIEDVDRSVGGTNKAVLHVTVALEPAGYHPGIANPHGLTKNRARRIYLGDFSVGGTNKRMADMLVITQYAANIAIAVY